MNIANQIADNGNVDLNYYIDNGNAAIRKGNMDECVKWYKQGLSKARELKNNEKIKEISLLLYTLF